MNLYYFTNTAVDSDLKVGKEVLYKRVACIGNTEAEARLEYPTQEPGVDEKGKPKLITIYEYLDDRYVLESVHKLSEMWNCWGGKK